MVNGIGVRAQTMAKAFGKVLRCRSCTDTENGGQLRPLKFLLKSRQFLLPRVPVCTDAGTNNHT